MWERSFGWPAPAVWPVAVGFTVSLSLVALLTALDDYAEATDLGGLTVGVIVCSIWARRVAAVAIGAIAWLFDNGFLVNRLGDLRWRGTADVVSLVVLIGAAWMAASVGARFRRPQAARTHHVPRERQLTH